MVSWSMPAGRRIQALAPKIGSGRIGLNANPADWACHSMHRQRTGRCRMLPMLRLPYSAHVVRQSANLCSCVYDLNNLLQ
jgi:hypothetical protein